MKYSGRNVSVSNHGDAVSILHAVGMSARPGCYSGRGASTSDLNGEQLCAMYESVLHHHGSDAAVAFAEMVSKLPKLTATDFILAMLRLQGSDWTKPSSLGEEKGFYVDAACDTEEGQTQAMLGLFAMLGGGDRRDETGTIRMQFLDWLRKLKQDSPDAVSDKVLELASQGIDRSAGYGGSLLYGL